jgi:hypothetical protein
MSKLNLNKNWDYSDAVEGSEHVVLQENMVCL